MVEVQTIRSTNRVAVISETSGNAGLIGAFNNALGQPIRVNGDNGGRLSIGCISSPADLALRAPDDGSLRAPDARWIRRGRSSSLTQELKP